MSDVASMPISGFVGNKHQDLIRGLIEKKINQKGVSSQSIDLSISIFANYNIDSLDFLELTTEIYQVVGFRRDLEELTFECPHKVTILDILKHYK